jgi:hypothetical protein
MEMTELFLFFFHERGIPRWATPVKEEGETSFMCRGQLPRVKPELERLAERQSFWGVLIRGEDRAIIVAHEGILTFIETDEDFEVGSAAKRQAQPALMTLLDMVSE